MNARFDGLKVAALAMLLIAGTAAPGLAQTYGYSFEVVGPPHRTANGWDTTVRVIGPSGQPVPNAEVYYRTLRPSGVKGVPQEFLRKIRLAPDGQGNYHLMTSRPLGPRLLSLEARVPGQSAPEYAMVPTGA